MGAENSVLEDCDIGKDLPVVSDVDWVLREAFRKNTTTNNTTPSFSVFTLKKKDRRREWDIIQLNTKHLRSLRHPGILQYVTSGRSSDGCYLVTEHVVPLEFTLKQLSPIEICSGLHGIIEALVFLHDTVRISHNNICKSSIFVVEDGSWKLGGFEHACHFKNLSPKFLDNCRALRCEKTISPEEKAGTLCVKTDFEHVIDAYAFGIVAEEFLDQLQDLGELSKIFEQTIQTEYLSPDPKQRSKLNSLLNNRLFKYENHFLEIKQFLRNITIKSSQEKQDFFSRVVSMLLDLPEELIGKRLISLLLSRFVVLDEDAVQLMLPSLLVPRSEKPEKKMCEESSNLRSIFSQESFKKYVIPELKKIFQVRDLHIRHLLLKYFSFYVELFDKNDVEEIIFPQLLLGLRDVNDSLVSASLYALGDLVPILGGHIVIGGPQKAYFKEGKPKFQASELKEMRPIGPPNLHSVMNKSLLKDFMAPKRSSLKTEKNCGEEEEKEEIFKKVISSSSPPSKEGNNQDTTITAKDKTICTNDAKPSQSPTNLISEDAFYSKQNVCQDTNALQEEEEDKMSENDWPDWDNNSLGWNETDYLNIKEIKADFEEISPSTDSSVKQLTVPKTDLTEEIDRINAVNKSHSNPIEPIGLREPYKKSWEPDKNKWEANDPSLVASVKSSQTSTQNTGRKSASSSKSLSQKSLGEEYDIMHISVTKKKDEIDYFVDMQPVILSTTSKDELLAHSIEPNPPIEERSIEPNLPVEDCSSTHLIEPNCVVEDRSSAQSIERNLLVEDHSSRHKVGLSFAVSEKAAAEVDTTGWDDNDLSWEELDSKIN